MSPYTIKIEPAYVLTLFFVIHALDDPEHSVSLPLIVYCRHRFIRRGFHTEGDRGKCPLLYQLYLFEGIDEKVASDRQDSVDTTQSSTCGAIMQLRKKRE